MVQRVDYYALLSQAVESLERDAYAARGAVYDREHKALLKRLISSTAPCSDADIAREEEAFRDAVRRIEFPDDEMQARRSARRAPAEMAWPASPREKTQARREMVPEPVIEPERASERGKNARWNTDFVESSGEPIGQQVDFQAGTEDSGPAWDAGERKPRLLFKSALVYVLLVAAVLGAAFLAYAFVMGDIDLRWLRSQAATPTEQALLYEGSQVAQTATPIAGKAIWRTLTEPGKSDLIITLDAEIPEPHVVLAMTLSHVAEASSGMSHLFELHFSDPGQTAFGGVSRVSNVAMRASQAEAGESLVGTSINIAPGQFMFGLLGVADVVKENVERLRNQKWLDFTLVFANGAAYTLSIEKGASGDRAISEALAQWGE